MKRSRKITRRSFLEKAFGAGAALAVVPRHALGDPSHVPTINKAVKADGQTQIMAVKRLLQRRVPSVASHFVLSLIARDNGRDVFEVESTTAGKILLRGSSGVALASGLNWYLKDVCRRQMSWCGSRLDLSPAEIKLAPDGKFRNVMPHQHVGYMNYCTLSYSMAWWDWERWQWEIDFMAMNGVTMPLGMVGLEGVWYHALLRMGLTDEESRQFLVGPAYFAWEWMQNIEGHCGPLPKTWIDSHIALGRQVLERERSFGMTPVQQGFSGHVPRIFKTKFPEARIRQQPSWCGFPGVAQLDALDPLFARFGRVFMEEEARLFGLGGYYAADPFHESAPPRDIPEAEMPGYLDSVGRNIHALFDGIDRASLWVMQSWSIRKDIASAVPKGRLLVVDLAGEKWNKTQGFWGHTFLVGQLHNFGGRINLHGDLAHLASNPFVAAKKDYPATAAGTGIFMEGIIQNPVFYDLFFDMVWRDGPAVLDDWLQEYTLRRYGVSDGAAAQAWKLLREGPYREGTSGVESSSIVAARPALDCKKSGPNEGFVLRYSPRELVNAWSLLLADQARCGGAEGYRFDAVDVGRQVLSNLGQMLHKNVCTAFASGDKTGLKQATAQFIDVLSDVDRLCETRGEYRFGDWLAAARKWGAGEADTALYDKNASMLVTCWGPEDNPRIFDYSWREWSGLIRSYYIPRWQKFHAMLAAKLEAGEAYSEAGLPQVYGREAWRANDFYASLADWELQWINTPKSHWRKLDAGSGEELTCANELLAKWKPVLDAAYG
jgi:alpha-N-acetylglucosaminidase